jgi:hypothetical protein
MVHRTQKVRAQIAAALLYSSFARVDAFEMGVTGGNLFSLYRIPSFV